MHEFRGLGAFLFVDFNMHILRTTSKTKSIKNVFVFQMMETHHPETNKKHSQDKEKKTNTLKIQKTNIHTACIA